jgi:hypothetical protein
MSPDAQAAWRAANEGRPAAEGKGSATSGKRGTLRWSEESGWAGTFGTSEYLRELTRAGVLGEIGTDAWATLTVLLSHANNDGQWKISYQTMAREMGMCERSVELHVAKLERDGVISKRLVPAGFGQWVNEYELQPLHEIQRTLEERGKRVRRGRKPRPPQSPW